MAVELRPLGVACNLACTYCYQEPLRRSGNKSPKYDVDKMLEEAEKTGQPFHLFGGEALLIPKKDLERFWKRGYELHKENGVQTNGTLIDEDHIELFKKYNVRVGVSIDGAYELNSLREVRGKEGKIEDTIQSTETIMKNLRWLKSENIETSVIITLHKVNGSKERLPRLLSFLRWLGDIGIKNGNIHTLEVDETMPDQDIHVLSQKENAYAFLEIAKFLDNNPDLRYNPFQDVKTSMEEDDTRTICIWNNCDPMNTNAVYGVEGDGGLSNCGRTAKEGIDWYKTEETSYERYISLYHTPQNLGGCQGCRFFMLCGGSCPGESMNGDFRNKTIHCPTQKALLGYYEKRAEEQGLIPFSKRRDLKTLEGIMINHFISGEGSGITKSIEESKRMNSRVSIIPVRKEGE